MNAFGDGYRGERMVYLHPWDDGENGFGAGYQTIHSLYALADGGLFGVGLGNSREKFLYLPANNTDYVFAVVCEELGVVGGMLIILCFLALLYFGLKISHQCGSSFSRGLSGSLITMLVFQAYLNIGCAISILPMTGKPLPFFSVGGSSMLATMIILGFVLACSRASEDETPEAEYARRRESLRVTTRVSDQGQRTSFTGSSDFLPRGYSGGSSLGGSPGGGSLGGGYRGRSSQERNGYYRSEPLRSVQRKGRR